MTVGFLRRTVWRGDVTNGPNGAGLLNRNLNKGSCRNLPQSNSLFRDKYKVSFIRVVLRHELNVWLHARDAGGEHGPAVCTPCNWKEFNLPCATPSLCVKANRQNGEIAEIFWQLMSWRLRKWSRGVGECGRLSQSGVHGAGCGLFWANSRYKCTFSLSAWR